MYNGMVYSDRLNSLSHISPSVRIRIAFSCLTQLIHSLRHNDHHVSLSILDELGYILFLINNVSLTERILNYITGIPELLSIVLNKHRVHKEYVIISKIEPTVETAFINEYHEHDEISYTQAIVDVQNIDDCYSVVYDVEHELGLRAFSFLDGRKEAIDLSILRKASRNIAKTRRKLGGQSLLCEYYQIPPVYTYPVDFDERYRLTLVTSLFNGKMFLPSFIENLTHSSVFRDVSLMIFDAGQWHEDFEILVPYLAKYKNIKYYRLRSDPGLYDIWNLGIHLSRTEYVGNANLDDRRHPLQLQSLLDSLENDKNLMLASTHVVPMTNFEADIYTYVMSAPHVYFSWMDGEYGMHDMFRIGNDGKIESQCIPHCMPLWRKTFHNECGYFNEKLYRSAADFELWLRGLSKGMRYSVVPIPASYYYINPNSYMRMDSTHMNIGQEMYDIYVSGSTLDKGIYQPDFEYLVGQIKFSVN